MKTSWTLISLFISSAAFATPTNVTTLDTDTPDSSAVQYGTNTNDRFNNLDERSNSLSTPSHYGAEKETLGEPENPSRMTGGSSTDPAHYDWERESGNPTTDWERAHSGAPDINRNTGGSTYEDNYQQRAPAHQDMRHRHQMQNAPNADSAIPDSATATDANRATGTSSDAAAAGTMGAASGAAGAMTAQDTARSTSEMEMVRKIRSELTSSTDLSTHAHNVKVINQNGQIYLKGPVANATERTKVEDIAKRFAGNTTVVNQTYVEKK